jgi:hypothetical protein
MQYGQLQIDTEPVASFQAGLDEQVSGPYLMRKSKK